MRAPDLTWRVTLAGDGRPGPIEERLGRRLLRLIDPLSPEGRGLASAGRVEWIGPDGKGLGSVTAEEACLHIRRRLERAAEQGDQEAASEALGRLDGWSERLRRDD